MYSPRIYDSQIPCLYHAAQNLEVPMTQLANAFVYYGLISGYYGATATELTPTPNRVLPENVYPRMQIFNPGCGSIMDCMNGLPPIGTLNPYFQALEKPKAVRMDAGKDVDDEPVPF